MSPSFLFLDDLVSMGYTKRALKVGGSIVQEVKMRKEVECMRASVSGSMLVDSGWYSPKVIHLTD